MADSKKVLEMLSRKLTDEGKLIEAGWVAFLIVAMPRDASAAQLGDMRIAYLAGAQHLFGSIMQILEPGVEPTDNDLSRMSQINNELNKVVEELKARTHALQGHTLQ